MRPSLFRLLALLLLAFAIAIGICSDAMAAPSSKDLRAVGDALFSDGDAIGSLPYYAELIRQNPKSVEAYSGRARLHVEMGEYELAVTDLNRAIELYLDGGDRGNSRFDHLLHRRAYSRSALKNYEQALADVDEALRQNPQYVNAWITKGNIMLETLRLDQAEASYHQALEIDPNSLTAETNLIGVAKERRDFTVARQLCAEWSGDAASGESSIVRGETIPDSPARITPASPGASIFYRKCAEVHREFGEETDRIKYLELGASAAVQGPADLRERAEARMLLKQYEAALADFAAIIETQPNNKKIRYRHASALFELDRPEDAKKDYQNILSSFENDGRALAGMAEAEARLGQLPEALEHAEASVQFSADDEYAWANLGWIRSKIGNVEGAAEAYQKAVEISPRYKYALDGLDGTRAKLIEAALAAGSYESAIPHLTAAIKDGRYREWALNYRAYAYAKSNRQEEGLRDAQTLAADFPKAVSSWTALAFSLAPKGRLLEAKSAVERGLDLEPGDASLMKMLAWLNDQLASQPAQQPPPAQSIKGVFIERALSFAGTSERRSEVLPLVVPALLLVLAWFFVRKCAQSASKVPSSTAPGLLLLLCIAVAVLLRLYYARQPTPSSNALQLAGEPQDILLHEPQELDGMKKEQVFAIRAERIAPYIGKYLKSYQPYEAVFGQIVDGAPWWGLDGLYRYGPGDPSIAGPSEETRMLGNPLLLVTLIESVVLANDTAPGSAAPWPRPVAFRVTPNKSEMAVVLKVGDYLQHLKQLGISRRLLTLVAYNARDFGFTSLTINGAKLSGFKAQADKPIALVQFLHQGNSCGYPGGCNNMSPAVPDLEVELISLPALIPIVLHAGGDNVPSINFNIELTY